MNCRETVLFWSCTSMWQSSMALSQCCRWLSEALCDTVYSPWLPVCCHLSELCTWHAASLCYFSLDKTTISSQYGTRDLSSPVELLLYVFFHVNCVTFTSVCGLNKCGVCLRSLRADWRDVPHPLPPPLALIVSKERSNDFLSGDQREQVPMTS